MSRTRPYKSLRGRLGAPLLLAALALVSVAPTAWTDDRDLVKQGQKDPYVFILLDVSGSMNQSVNCSQADFDAGLCTSVCPEGDCLPHAISDDPASKLRTAKEAIYEIMQKTDNINFGFGTYDQGQVRVARKHWWYALRATQPSGFITLDSGKVYPEPGQQQVFGEASWYCTEAYDPSDAAQVTSVRFIGCPLTAPWSNPLPGNVQPADLNNPWEAERVRHWPKLGLLRGGGATDALTGNNYTRHYYIRDNADNRIYKVHFQPLSYPTDALNGLGQAQVTARIRVERCNNATTCNAPTLISSGQKDLVWVKQEEMIYWESGEKFQDFTTAFPPKAFYGAGTGVRNFASGNAISMDPNTDTTGNQSTPLVGNQDRYTTSGTTINLRQDTVADPFGRGATMTIGDIIPLDWRSNQRDRVMQRMAPNTIINPSAAPDFGVATYFRDFRVGSEAALRLADDRARPLVPDGGTPVGGSLNAVKSWIQSWYPVASAATGDPNFACRNTYVLLITDGLASNTDTPDACDTAEALRKLQIGGKDYPVRTYVVALGLSSNVYSGYDNTISCVAWRGGTGKTPGVNNCVSTATDPSADSCEVIGGPAYPGTPPRDDGPGPLFPQNKQQLVDALNNILSLINTQSRSFAAAAVPSVQANIQDKVVLSSFTPVKEVIWPGRIDAYIKPIPTKTVNLTLADGTTESRVVPDRDKVCTSPSQIECRLWDGGDQLLLQAPDDTEITSGNFNLDTSGGGEDKRRVFYMNTGAAGTAEDRRFLQLPSSTADWTDMLVGMKICAPLDAVCQLLSANRTTASNTIRFVHKVKHYDDPTQLGATIPYLLGDVFHSDPLVVGEPNNFRYFASNLNNYRDFFAKHRYRRKILLVGSNDGELHAFDAGIFRGTANGAGVVSGQFDNGSGRELFAFVPRAVMPALKKAYEDDAANKKDQHTYKVDGAVVTADVYINPLFPSTGTREWRTVAIGGLREGGGTFPVGGRSVFSSYYALDITQPDELDTNKIPQPAGGSLKYVPSCTLGSSNCGQTPFPGVLWEFSDQCLLGACDEEPLLTTGKGTPDLGDTWSVPNIGRIKICTSTTLPCAAANIQDRFVAIFGGGMDPTRTNVTGNWLYMVDIETGKLLYKRQLDGSAPSKPAAVDTDLDGYLDTIYIGTVRGFLYKADIRTAQPLTTVSVGDQRVTAAAWNPFQIFNTQGRPLYYPPAVVFVTQKGRYALAFGTGDRERLWEPTTATGRYYVILDDGFSSTTTGLPYTAANYQALSVSSTSVAGADYLVNNTNASLKNGWYLELDTAERVITDTFALSGVVVFSSFQPKTTTGSSGSSTVCGFAGTSRIFVMNTVNGNAIYDLGQRFRTVKDFVTSPFTERGQTKNDPDGGGPGGTGSQAEELTENLRRVMLELQRLFPTSCRFSNYTINIKAVRSDTGLEFIAPVPVCMIEKNWKEF